MLRICNDTLIVVFNKVKRVFILKTLMEKIDFDISLRLFVSKTIIDKIIMMDRDVVAVQSR